MAAATSSDAITIAERAVRRLTSIEVLLTAKYKAEIDEAIDKAATRGQFSYETAIPSSVWGWPLYNRKIIVRALANEYSKRGYHVTFDHNSMWFDWSRHARAQLKQQQQTKQPI